MSKTETSGLKLSELRPCDNCGGAIAPTFYVVDSAIAIFGRGTQETLGLAVQFGGLTRPGALAIAEAMGPSADKAIEIVDGLRQRYFVCRDCFHGIKQFQPDHCRTVALDFALMAENKKKYVKEVTDVED
jgi:hypothetical protein